MKYILLPLSILLLIWVFMPEDEKTLTIAHQHGLTNLPLLVMQDQHIFEKKLEKANIVTKIVWRKLGSGAAVNEGLISGNIDIGVAGVPVLLRIWDKTHKNIGIKALAALSRIPMVLIARNENINSLRDFKAEDKIALPAIKVSGQAIILQMAAENEFGKGHNNDLDAFTVSMSHPDGMSALTAPIPMISAHLTTPPFSNAELEHEGTKQIFSSYDLLGDGATLDVLMASEKFHQKHPVEVRLFLESLQEANEFIINNPKEAAHIFNHADNSAFSEEMISKILTGKEVSFNIKPSHIKRYIEFMNRTGQLTNLPVDDKELFFEENVSAK